MDVSILANTCRCCMADCEQMHNLYDKFVDIGSKIDPDLTYSDAIYLCTNIDIYEMNGPDDATVTGLPQYICDDCLRDLRVAVLFRAKCEETDALLRKHVKTDSENIGTECVEKSNGNEHFEDLIIEQIHYSIESTENNEHAVGGNSQNDDEQIVRLRLNGFFSKEIWHNEYFV